MASDRARVSYDERQQYRSVVMQQGRVTLEADWNEAGDIASEELRKETLDIVGPSGTPDNGYQITLGTGFDFSIGHGTMYVGGERVCLFDPTQTVPPGTELLYSQQDQALQPAHPSEWLDAITDPDWFDLSSGAPPSPEIVYLQLREQEISAVEDSDLKDVALGGPDTAQRTRLVQHIVRRPGSDCIKSFFDTYWINQGLRFDSASMRLLSDGRLQVGFSGQTPPPGPCQPQAQGGYLGADNQLIRVQISTPHNPKLSNSGASQAASPRTILWGFDDSSFLYRVDVANPTTLHLQSAPVDAFHYPRAGQAVEVLLSAVQLTNGEYAAAPTGFVTTVAQAYNPDTQTVVLTDPIPLIYGDGTKNNPSPARVFLRIWEQQLPFTPAVPVVLGSTGVQVTLTLSEGTVFHLGDFWMFAVRPSTPQRVYPERLLTVAQPPSGPREWVCPLGVIVWSSFAPSTVRDCRHFFSALSKPASAAMFGSANGGAAVGPQNTLNFIGAGITVANNTATGSIDVTLPAASSSEGAPTNLLFPFVTNGEGFDTAIVISNTTLPPFGPAQPATGEGNCTIHYFPANGTPSTTFTFPLLPGHQRRFTMALGDQSGQPAIPSNKGFVGYVIVACNFSGAYGFAQILGVAASTGVSQSMTGYLAVILPKRQ